MLAGREDRAITVQVLEPRLLRAIILPHRHGIQSAAPTCVVVGQASRTKPPRAWLDSGSPETLSPTDADSGVTMRVEHRRRDRQQFCFDRDIVDTVNVDHFRPPFAKRAERHAPAEFGDAPGRHIARADNLGTVT
jgi:hypothetical protein